MGEGVTTGKTPPMQWRDPACRSLGSWVGELPKQLCRHRKAKSSLDNTMFLLSAALLTQEWEQHPPL